MSCVEPGRQQKKSPSEQVERGSSREVNYAKLRSAGQALERVAGAVAEGERRRPGKRVPRGQKNTRFNTMDELCHEVIDLADPRISRSGSAPGSVSMTRQDQAAQAGGARGDCGAPLGCVRSTQAGVSGEGSTDSVGLFGPKQNAAFTGGALSGPACATQQRPWR